MKRIILGAAKADWDVRLHMSRITTVWIQRCRHLIAPCLLNIWNLHKQHFNNNGKDAPWHTFMWNYIFTCSKRQRKSLSETNKIIKIIHISEFCVQKKIILVFAFMLTSSTYESIKNKFPPIRVQEWTHAFPVWKERQEKILTQPARFYLTIRSESQQKVLSQSLLGQVPHSSFRQQCNKKRE